MPSPKHQRDNRSQSIRSTRWPPPSRGTRTVRRNKACSAVPGGSGSTPIRKYGFVNSPGNNLSAAFATSRILAADDAIGRASQDLRGWKRCYKSGRCRVLPPPFPPGLTYANSGTFFANSGTFFQRAYRVVPRELDLPVQLCHSNNRAPLWWGPILIKTRVGDREQPIRSHSC
jgi:hypothetical protein